MGALRGEPLKGKTINLANTFEKVVLFNISTIIEQIYTGSKIVFIL